jgi:hypothetical protein
MYARGHGAVLPVSRISAASGWVREADEPAFPDDLLLRLQRHGHQRLVIGVIDLDRRLDGGLGELGITAENRR